MTDDDPTGLGGQPIAAPTGHDQDGPPRPSPVESAMAELLASRKPPTSGARGISR